MVVGLQSRAGLAQLDYVCAGQPALLQTERAERAVLAALLQSAFGVSASDVAWSEAKNETEASVLWAVGRTPFGPYSARSSLSFALRDAAARAALHARAAEVLAELHGLSNYYEEFGVGIDEAPPRPALRSPFAPLLAPLQPAALCTPPIVRTPLALSSPSPRPLLALRSPPHPLRPVPSSRF